MARALARPLRQTWPAASDEFESAALFALVEAAGAFRPDRQVRFATYARHRIQGALRDVQRRLVPKGWRSDDGHDALPHFVSLHPAAERSGRILAGSQPVAPIGQDLEAADALEPWLRRLPRRHAEVCREIYLHGATQSEAALRLGYSQSRLSCIHQEAIAILNGTWNAVVSGRSFDHPEASRPAPRKPQRPPGRGGSHAA